ncbi:MAG: peptide-N(4)-(N-acetyl-beta-glucosaminyl)asparagine amidase, partial [Acidobacteria bacterium]
MNYTRLRTFLVIASLGAVSLFTLAAHAQSTNRQIGTQLTVTADPLVPRPHTRSCVVPLFTNYQFAFFSGTTQNYQFTPPANCPGPWNKVVLDINFSENAGRQFDRTATLYMGNTNLYFGTTPEPIRTATNTWHVERDITDYSALLANPQQGFMVLQNCTTDCPPPYNTLLTGVFTVSAELEFFPTPGGSPAPKVADEVLPLVQTNAGGSNFPAFLFSPTDQFSTTFTLPQNIEQAYLDVIAQSQSTDEQWYGCFPNDLASINEVYACGNTDFRETEVTIDGQPAGIAPVSPWVYTGFLPDQWRPMPAAQTLDFVPYRVNLTPFAGILNDGQPHTVSLSVFNDDSYFSAAASLLLYLDHGSAEVTGALTQNTLTAPSPVVSENLQGTSEV